MPTLDIDFIRSQFPAFAEPSLKEQAFFENAGGSYTSGAVIDRLECSYRQRKVQPYYPFEASRLAGEEMDEARQRLSAVLNIEADELSFGPSTTQNTYVLAQAFGQMLEEGDAIIVTNQDHEANSGPWRRLAARGIDVREWKVDDEGHLDPASLSELLDDRVKLVCFPHVSNLVAEINPVAHICDLVRAAGAYSCVDGVSAAPHGLPDIGGLGADIYLFSAYKTFGPHQGIMAIKQVLADRLPNQGHFFNEGARYKRFTPAGPDHAQVAACAGMVDYLDTVHAHHFDPEPDGAARGRAVQALTSNHEAKLLAPLINYLRARNDVRLLGPQSAEGRVATVSIAAKKTGLELAEALVPHGIMAGGGDFYAVRLLAALGIAPVHGALRLSFAHYTSEAEVTKLLAALDQVL